MRIYEIDKDKDLLKAVLPKIKNTFTGSPAIRIPKLKINKVQVDKLGFDESRLNMVVHIENPSLFSLSLKNAGYTFTIDKVLKLEGTIEKIINVPPRSSQSVPMLLDIKTAKVVG